MSHLTEDYDIGYEDGYNDAFAVRTSEALATIRMFWRKLALARRQRDIILHSVSMERPSASKMMLDLSAQLAESEAELRAANRLVGILRDELGKKHEQWLGISYPQGYGSYTIPASQKYSTNNS